MRWLATAREHPAPRIDWLELSDDSHDWHAWKPGPGSPALEVDPLSEYSRAWKDGTGARLDVDLRFSTHRWHLELPGLAAASRTKPELLKLPGRIVRMDLALDTDGPCTPAWIRNALLDKRAVCRWRQGTDFNRWDLHDPTSYDTAPTIYMGKRGSASFLRVYNRSAKLGLAGNITRWELELRDYAAKVAHKALATSSVQLVMAGILSGKLRIYTDAIDATHTTRGTLDPNWQSLWTETDALATSPPELDPARKTARRIRALRHLSRALALANELDPTAVTRLLEDGTARATPDDALATASERDQTAVRAEIDRCQKKKSPPPSSSAQGPTMNTA